MSGLLSKLDLRLPFEEGLKPPSAFGVGLEYERFGVAPPAVNAPVPLDGPVSIAGVFDALVSRFGWQQSEENGRVLALSRAESRITLEPGLQMELSGRVHRGLDGAAAELRSYLDEVQQVSEPLGIRWLSAGTHPMAALDVIPWLPKTRYVIMREYLPTRGRLAHHMMKGTCGAQVNLDFSDEADAMAKLRVAMILTSTASAMFANSPITAGSVNGYMTERAAVWLDTDPDRCGLLRFALEPSASFDDYVAYALKVPMIFLVRGDRWIPLRGMTFASFLERGHDGERATLEDWRLHLTTLFPDVRLKGYLEVRGTDSNAPGLVLAHAALWKGILYGGPDALEAAAAPLERLTWDDHLRLRADVAPLGLRARAGSRRLSDVARELIDVAASGLESAGARGEDRFLDPIRDLILSRGITPAEDTLARFGVGSKERKEAVVEHLSRHDLRS